MRTCCCTSRSHDYFAERGKGLLAHFDGGGAMLAGTPFRTISEQLQARGYEFDYVSDRQIATLQVDGGRMSRPRGRATGRSSCRRRDTCRSRPPSDWWRSRETARPWCSRAACPTTSRGGGTWRRGERRCRGWRAACLEGHRQRRARGPRRPRPVPVRRIAGVAAGSGGRCARTDGGPRAAVHAEARRWRRDLLRRQPKRPCGRCMGADRARRPRCGGLRSDAGAEGPCAAAHRRERHARGVPAAGPGGVVRLADDRGPGRGRAARGRRPWRR